MTDTFEPQANLVVVRATIFGPQGSTVLRLALDTGATTTMINRRPLEWIGCDLSSSADIVRITTGSRREHVPRITIQAIDALGHHQAPFEVLAHTLPPSAGVDGLLGLDFLRQHVLTLDFRRGQVTLG